MDRILELKTIKQALKQTRPGPTAQRKMLARPIQPVKLPALPEDARPAAVLILLHPENEQINFFLTERTDKVDNHKGQISLPGGAREFDESLANTACRETEEEIGIPAANITILSELSQLPVPISGYIIYPFIGWVDNISTAKPEPGEVNKLFNVSIGQLLDDGNQSSEQRQIRGYDVHVPFFNFNGHKVWGATAMILAEFKEILVNGKIAQ